METEKNKKNRMKHLIPRQKRTPNEIVFAQKGMSFKEAFRNARNNKLKYFTFEGKVFNSKDKADKGNKEWNNFRNNFAEAEALLTLDQLDNSKAGWDGKPGANKGFVRSLRAINNEETNAPSRNFVTSESTYTNPEYINNENIYPGKQTVAVNYDENTNSWIPSSSITVTPVKTPQGNFTSIYKTTASPVTVYGYNTPQGKFAYDSSHTADGEVLDLPLIPRVSLYDNNNIVEEIDQNLNREQRGVAPGFGVGSRPGIKTINIVDGYKATGKGGRGSAFTAGTGIASAKLPLATKQEVKDWADAYLAQIGNSLDYENVMLTGLPERKRFGKTFKSRANVNALKAAYEKEFKNRFTKELRLAFNLPVYTRRMYQDALDRNFDIWLKNQIKRRNGMMDPGIFSDNVYFDRIQ